VTVFYRLVTPLLCFGNGDVYIKPVACTSRSDVYYYFSKVLFITMEYFRSGFINEHCYWEYSGESVYLVLYPEEQVKYRVFTQNCRTLFQYCQCKAIGKCTERAAVAAPDVVDKC
jgi:hypothetical protein